MGGLLGRVPIRYVYKDESYTDVKSNKNKPVLDAPAPRDNKSRENKSGVKNKDDKNGL